MKFEELVAVPETVDSVIRPVLAPEGTVAVTLPSFAKAKDAEVPLNRTALTPVKWFPLIVTDVPITPLEGENPLMVGALPPVTLKFDELVAVPETVDSVIRPVLAPEGTVAVTLPSFAKAKDAEVPLNRTALTPVKWFPLIVTDVPITPLEGENPLMVGALPPVTLKFDELVAVPETVDGVIRPVLAPGGQSPSLCRRSRRRRTPRSR